VPTVVGTFFRLTSSFALHLQAQELEAQATRLKTDVKAAQKAQASAEAEAGRQKEQLLKFKKAAEENEVKFQTAFDIETPSALV
jgi:hypothetical protein